MNNMPNRQNEGSDDEERTQGFTFRYTRKEKSNQHAGLANMQAQQFSNHRRIPSNGSKRKKEIIQNQHEINNNTTYIDPQNNHHASSQIQNQLLSEIQLINYNEPYSTLKELFKDVVKTHIAFDGIFPKALTKTGRELIKNGLFHEMWSKVCKKGQRSVQTAQYYQLYYPQITSNHSNFQAAFNQQDSASSYFSISNEAAQEDDSITRLTKRSWQDTRKSVPFVSSIQEYSHNSQEESIKEREERIFSGRLRLIDRIQTNQRRLNAEMVCFFLGIKQYYNIIDIHIEKIEELYQAGSYELLIVKAHLPAYNKAVEKVVVDYKPRTLIAMYGFVNFPMLLRIKRQYVKIDGFILYDQLLNLTLWLTSNGYSIPKK